MAITSINTVLREIIVKLKDEHFNFQSEDLDLKVIFETLHIWLEDMRGRPEVDMMDTYRAMVFVGLVNFIYLHNLTPEESDDFTDFFVRSAHELLEIFGDQQSVMESFTNEGETMH